MNVMTEQPLKTLIVTGPQGCGKSRLAPRIAAHFGLAVIVDGWDGQSVPAEGGLLLTSVPPEELNAGRVPVMSFDEVVSVLTCRPLMP